MRFMMIVKASKDSEAGVMPSDELIGCMMKYNEELVKAGVLLAGDGLHPSSNAVRISYPVPGGKPVVTDGPFAESKELVAGFWILQGRSKEEIVERLLQCPFEGGEFVEIRQIADDEEISARIARKHERG